ncbi:hypothetical protein H0H87_000479 [Tephrocybe sp. NHM501043]|nr:hypothetical protein H0H87_000479 [Tephrocybe sp. NHM501043]
MAQSFIGKPISLISHSDVRYRGILAGIDPAASTIQLSNVFSMGTETRRPPAEFIPPVQEPYQYIIFRASEVKDLAVDEPTPRRSVHDDPAVLAVPPPNASPYPASAQQAYPQPVPQQQQQQPPPPQQQHQAPQAQPQPQTPHANVVAQQQQHPGRRSNPVHTAAASLETVERAIGDLRVSNGRGGRRGGAATGGRGRADVPQQQQQQHIKVPTTDFDFASSNAKFDKAALTPKALASAKSAQGSGSEDDEGEEGQNGEDKEKTKEKEDVTAYNPTKSFFDSLSSNTQAPPPSNGNGGGFRGRRGGRGGVGRNRREEERERNVATFGEPGGVGLLGPGAYVGGWGGYGRRGGGRPRRGGPGPGGNVPVEQQQAQAAR